MRCNICDALLSPEEIKFETDYGRYAPCRRCIDASGVLATNTEPTELEELEALTAILFGEGDEDEDTTEGSAPLY